MNKGGRPKKENKRSQQLAVMCTIAERKIIEDKAKLLNISISQYLREIGLSGQVDIKLETFPREILLFTATLNHLASNMNQVAKKRNRMDELNAMERAGLTVLATGIKQLAFDIKKQLQ